MSDVTVSAAQKARRWPLYASLFLNVVLITVLAVGAWRIHQFRDSVGAGLGAWLPRQIERLLPSDTAAKVKTIREAHADHLKPLFERARSARDAVRKALDTEPLDSAGLKAALLSMREADSAVAAATADVIVEIAETLSPAERQLVREKARDFRKHPRRPGRGGDDRRGGPGGSEEGPSEGPPPGEMAPPPEEPAPPPPTP